MKQQISEEYHAYMFKIWLMAGTTLVFSLIGAVLAITMRILFITKLNKSLFRAATNMQSAGQILKKMVLEPTVLAVIAHERGGMDHKEVCDEYDDVFKKPIKLCANLFGYDSITKDFVKYFDSKLLSMKKGKAKKLGKKSKK